MEQIIPAINLSPQNFIYELEGKQKFVLDSQDRLDLQRYLLEGMTLPTTNDTLKKAFCINDDQKMECFHDLLSAYQQIKDHCTVFYNGAYTESVLSASTIVHFNISAQTYLNGIVTIADDFEHGRITSDHAEKSVSTIINAMVEQLAQFISKADAVCSGINTFLTETYSDNAMINGQDGTSGLKKEYIGKYNLNEENIRQLQNDIETALKALDQATAEYNHDVVVAATTPTYVWVFPIGTIPAVVVAGVYGSSATAAYKKMTSLRKQLKSLESERNLKAAMTSSLSIASNQISNLAVSMQKAIKPIETIKGSWIALQNDLNALNDTVTGDITTLPMCVKKLGVDKALKEWELVSKEAAQYRNNAFITETSADLVETSILRFPNPKCKA